MKRDMLRLSFRFGSRSVRSESEWLVSHDTLQTPTGESVPTSAASAALEGRARGRPPDLKTRAIPRMASSTPGIVHNVNVVTTVSTALSSNGIRSPGSPKNSTSSPCCPQ
jgi:hypothetical protein